MYQWYDISKKKLSNWNYPMRPSLASDLEDILKTFYVTHRSWRTTRSPLPLSWRASSPWLKVFFTYRAKGKLLMRAFMRWLWLSVVYGICFPVCCFLVVGYLNAYLYILLNFACADSVGLILIVTASVTFKASAQ